MNIIKQNVPYAQIPNSVLYDPKLSWKAKGIFSYILAKPDDWDFNSKRMAEEVDDGIESTRNGINELIQSGYLQREKQPDGRMVYRLDFIGIDESHPKSVKVLHHTKSKSLNGLLPKREKPTEGKTHSGETRPIYNKDYKQTKNITNKDYTPDFSLFWSIYPKKVGKHKTYLLWRKLKPEEVQIILKDVPKRKHDQKWVEGFIKDPERYINTRQWEDEIIKSSKKISNVSISEEIIL